MPLPARSATKLSKSMTYVLRHGAEKEKIEIDSKGFIKLSDLLSKAKGCRGFTEACAREVVQICPKQRFFIEEREDGPYIRANQGHTLTTVGVEMEKITDPNIVAVHGTYLRAWEAITISGLSKMKRQHIHLAAGLPGDKEVKSGARGNAQLFIYINVPLAMEDGIEFFRSANNVILTSGINGSLSPKYFSRAIEVKTGADLLLQ